MNTEDIAQLMGSYVSIQESVKELDLGEISIFTRLSYNPTAIDKRMRAIEPNQQVRNKEIMKLIAFAQLRGMNYDKALLTMSATGKMEMERLIAKYRLQRRAMNGDPEIVTLQRIVSTYPPIVAQIMKKFNIIPIGYNGSIGLYPFLCFPGAPAIFPVGAIGDNLMAKWSVWYVLFKQIIKAPKGGDEIPMMIRDNSIIDHVSKYQILYDLGVEGITAEMANVQTLRNMNDFGSIATSSSDVGHEIVEEPNAYR